MVQTNEILSLLQTACLRRKPLQKTTNAMRLVNGRGDGMEGLILEQYDRHFIVQVLHAAWLEHIETLTDFLCRQFKPRYFILKDRISSSAAHAQAVRSQILINEAGSKTIIQEYGVRFEVDLNDTLNAGLFLDMRANRRRIAQMACGKRVLNCFAYTCSFGVHARLGGALEAVNIDVSKKILERGEVNYQLNSLAVQGQEFVRADAGVYLERAVKKGNWFDIIVIDPPSFARASKNVFQVKKNLPKLVTNAVKVLNGNGTLFVSTNFSELTHNHLMAMLQAACGNRKIKHVQHLGQDIDYPGSGTMKESYLAAVLVKF